MHKDTLISQGTVVRDSTYMYSTKFQFSLSVSTSTNNLWMYCVCNIYVLILRLGNLVEEAKLKVTPRCKMGKGVATPNYLV